MDPELRGEAPVQQRLLRERVVPLRRVALDHGRRASQAVSQWGNVYVPGDPNNPPVTRSDYDPGHRITTVVLRYPVGRVSATASVFYSGQSGRPWSALSRSTSTATSARPTTCSTFRRRRGMTFTNGTYQQLVTFVHSTSSACPTTSADPRAQRLPLAVDEHGGLSASTSACRSSASRPRSRSTCSICSTSSTVRTGLIHYANFNDLLVVQPAFTGSAVTYNLAEQSSSTVVAQTPEQQFTRYDLASRWQMQLGARLRF